VVRRDRERSGGLTLGLRSRRPGDRNGPGVDGESPDDEEGESSFEGHDDIGRADNNGTRPEVWEVGERTGVSCTAAEETREYTSTIL